MIHEEICIYEVCKLAKEKGFVAYDACSHIYEDDDQWYTLTTYTNPKGIDWSKDKFTIAPTQSLLQRWLREEKNIDIAIVPSYAGGYSYIVYNIHCRDNRVVNTNAGYATYELALEDALKYALENLVV